MEEFPTTDVEEMIRIMNTYTTGINVVAMPSGGMTGNIKYGRRPKSINSIRCSEDAVLYCMYKMIMGDMFRECFQVEKFKMYGVKL